MALQVLASMLLLAVQNNPNVSAELKAKATAAAGQAAALMQNCAGNADCAERIALTPAPRQAVVAAEITAPEEKQAWNSSSGPLTVNWSHLAGADPAAWPFYVRLDLEGNFGRGPEERIVVPAAVNLGSAVIPSEPLPPGNYRLFLIGLTSPAAGPHDAWSIAMPRNITVQ